MRADRRDAIASRSAADLEMAGAPPVSRFRVTLEQVIEDQEPNAEITTGLTYRRMTDRDANDFTVKVFRILRGEP